MPSLPQLQSAPDSLQEQLNFEHTRRPLIDPTLQNQLNALERRLDILNQCQKELINQQESSLREEAKNSPASNSEYRQIEQRIITIDSEQKQTAISLQHAEMNAFSLRNARTGLDFTA